MGAAVRGADGQMYGGINLYHFTGKAALRRGHTFPPGSPAPVAAAELAWPGGRPGGGWRLAFARRTAPDLGCLGQCRGGDGGAALLAPAEAPGCQPCQRGLDLGEREPFGGRAV